MANKREVSKAIRGLNEKTTLHAEDMYRNFFDNAQVGFFRTRLSDGKVLMANDGMAQMLGYSRAEEIMNDSFASEHYVDSGTRERMVAELMEKGEVKNFEARFRCKDGSAIWARFTARLCPGRDYLEGVLVDVTEEKRAVEALRVSEERYRILADNAVDLVWSLDSEGRITYCSPSVYNLTGYRPDELIGKPFVDSLSSDSVLSVLPIWEEKAGSRNLEEPVTVEVEFARKDGSTVWTEVIAAVRVDEDGNFAGAQGMAREITQRKLAEEEIRQKNIELQAALAVKMEFLSMVSHELRTPLVPIMGYSELLLDGMLGDLSKEAKDALRVIHKRSQDLKRLIEDLLLVSRMDQRAVRIESKPVSADHLVRSLLESYQALDHGKDVSFLHECEPCEIMADPERLKQVLHNLIGNAVKYSKESVVVTVRTGKRNGSGFIQISDNGIGISRKHLPHVFERFYQVEDLDTRTHEGTGLGLAITRGLVELMGGTIQAESELGVGSTFTIALPLAPEGEISQGGEGKGSDGQGVERSGRQLSLKTRRKRVLVIDDDPVTAAVVQGMLRDRYDVVTAPTASEVLQTVRLNGIDLVLLDWLMSGMDGLSVLREIKSNESTKGVPVVLLSGITEHDAIDKVLQSGAAGFVPKPFRKEDLVCLLQDLIGD